MTYSQFFQGNELHRGITANGKYPHYLEKNKSFNHEEHIKGIKSQGLSPLRQKTNEEEAYCIYGGIDFDFEEIPPATEFCKFIDNISNELFVFESKSSGYHVYWSANKWIKASKMKDAMERLKKKINPTYKADRVIPYETKLKDIEKQCGFWFNAPYFADTRRCLNHLGDPLTLGQFELRYKLRKHHFLSAIVGWKAAKKGTGKVGRHQVLWRAALYQKYRMPGQEKILDEINNSFNPPIENEREIEHAKDIEGKDEAHLDRNLKNYYEEIGIKEKFPEPPPNLFEGTDEYENYAFNNGSGATGQESRNKNKTKQKIISFKQMAMKEEDFHKKIERTYIVSPLICDVGLYILAGRPKGGKSRILKDLTYKIQNKGLGSWLGHTVVNGDGLLLGLEDNEDSMNLDIKDMGYQNKIKPTTFVEESPKLGEGLEESITLWTKEVSNPKLVIIDPFQKVKPLGEQKTRNANAYEIDYHYLSMLHSLARELKICIIYVHHLSQAEKGHSWDKIMGSTGHQGVVDAMYMLEREEGSNKATLKGIGRNIKEFKIDLEWNSNPKQPHTFQYVGDSFKISTQIHKREIYKAMRQLAKDGQCSVKPADVYKVLNYVSNKEKGACNKNMMRMKEKSELLEGDAYGTYKLAYGVEKYDEQGNLNLGGIF